MKILIISALLMALASASEEEALQEFTTGNRLFAGALYKEVLKENNDNFVISPFSIQTVLALTQSGAKDDTASEIRNSLRLPTSPESTETAYKALLSKLKGNDQYTLHAANKIYIKDTYKLNSTFSKLASEVYQSEIEKIDFSHKIEAVDSINNWVVKQTEGKINGLLDSNNLDDRTKLVLINALYFKAKWVNPFETYSTTKKDFFRSAKDVVKVDTMTTTELYNYAESSDLDAKILELPYQGGEASMVIVLPNQKEGLVNLEKQIDKVFVTPQFTQERVTVSLPKFKVESKVQLKKILQNLGIQKAFTEDADLSGITGSKGEIAISDVIQKAFINVTETGTEAAAATAVIGVDRIGLFEPPHLIHEFNVDHPFIFYIKLKQNNIVLFCGRVITPQV